MEIGKPIRRRQIIPLKQPVKEHPEPIKQSAYAFARFHGIMLSEFVQQELAQQGVAQQGVANPGLSPSPLPAPPLPAPDHPELLDLISFRAWILTPFGLLKSTAINLTWLPEEIIEGDPFSNQGIHSYKTITDALDHDDAISPNKVVGSILSWGEIVEHENGYRSQFAKINSLDYIATIPGIFPWDPQNELALNWLRRKYLLLKEDSP